MSGKFAVHDPEPLLAEHAVGPENSDGKGLNPADRSEIRNNIARRLSQGTSTSTPTSIPWFEEDPLHPSSILMQN